jgi:hypothetical protein
MHIVRVKIQCRETRHTPTTSNAPPANVMLLVKITHVKCAVKRPNTSIHNTNQKKKKTLTTSLSFVWPLRISFLRPSPVESLRCCRPVLSIPLLLLPLIFWPRLVWLAPPIVRLFLGLKGIKYFLIRACRQKE